MTEYKLTLEIVDMPLAEMEGHGLNRYFITMLEKSAGLRVRDVLCRTRGWLLSQSGIGEATVDGFLAVLKKICDEQPAVPR